MTVSHDIGREGALAPLIALGLFADIEGVTDESWRRKLLQ
jgi:hypothetical protein